LLAECVDVYLPLRDEAEQEAFRQILTDSRYEEAKSMGAPTIFEEGLQQGKLVGQREMPLLVMEGPFGSVCQRIEQLSPDELHELARQLRHAKSLSELGPDA
jgi:hypothetical protein